METPEKPQQALTEQEAIKLLIDTMMSTFASHLPEAYRIRVRERLEVQPCACPAKLFARLREAVLDDLILNVPDLVQQLGCKVSGELINETITGLGAALQDKGELVKLLHQELCP